MAQEKEYDEYRVVWEIDITAENEVDAAQRAHEIMLDPESLATIFNVCKWPISQEKFKKIDIANL